MKLACHFTLMTAVSAQGEEKGRWVSGQTLGARSRISSMIPNNPRRFSLFTDIMTHRNSNFNVYYGGSYGCHCAFLASDRPLTSPGIGPPVDDLDRTCKNFKSCLSCAREKYGTTCISELQEYGYTKESNGYIQCTDQADTCQRAICECTALFAVEHAAIDDVTNGFLHYMNYPMFKHQEICPHLCNKEKFDLSNSSEHLEEGTSDGRYPSLEFLVNGRKCYEKEDGSQIVWNSEQQRWEITKDGEVEFVHLSDQACPPKEGWNLTNEDGSVGEGANILVGRPNVGPEEAYDGQCCANPIGPFSIFNSVSQECCSDGSIAAIGDC